MLLSDGVHNSARNPEEIALQLKHHRPHGWRGRQPCERA